MTGELTLGGRLREHNYRRDQTAKSLGISTVALWRKLSALGLARRRPK